MSNFALVSTVDTQSETVFPCHCVMLFETEEAAIRHAVDLIVEYDDSVDVNDGWSIGTESGPTQRSFLRRGKTTSDQQSICTLSQYCSKSNAGGNGQSRHLVHPGIGNGSPCQTPQRFGRP